MLGWKGAKVAKKVERWNNKEKRLVMGCNYNTNKKTGIT
jgi:hypothetical protein